MEHRIARAVRRLSAAVAIVALTAAAAGCSSKNSGSPSGGPTPRPSAAADERPSPEVKLTGQTVVVDGEGGKTLKSVASDGVTFTLDAKADGVDRLQPGSILLLTGVTVVKVATVDRRGDEVNVVTQPASIGEVIVDGDLSWSNVRSKPAAFHVWEPRPEDTEIKDDPDRTGGTGASIRPSAYREARGPVMHQASFRAAIAQGPKPSGAVSAGDYNFKYNVSTDDNGATHLHIDATRDGNLRASATIKATMSSVITEGRMRVERSVLNALELKSNSWEGDADINFEAAVGGEIEPIKQQITKLPISVDYPVVIYGIPFNLNVSAKILFEPAFTSKNSVMKGQAKVTFGGSVGLSYQTGTVSGTSNIRSDAPDPIKFIDGLGIGASAMIIAAQVPKVGFGLGWASTNVGVFLDSVLSAGVTVSPSTSIVACYRADINYTASVGIDARFLDPDGSNDSINLTKKPIYTQDWTFIGPNVPACTNPAKS